MTVRSRCGRVALFAVLVLGVVCGRALAQSGVPTGASSSVTPHDGRLDLADPKVRERLRAAGVDPDDLQKLLSTGAGAAPAGPWRREDKKQERRAG